MKSVRRIVTWMGVAACTLILCAPPMLHAQDTQTDTTSKPKKTKKSKKSKKTAADEAASQAGTTTGASDNAATTKTPKSKKSKNSFAEETPAATPSASSRAKTKEPAPVRNASASEIQAAKSSGKVWVNTDSGIYHKSGQWFGATKQGKFMTEQDAVRSGYKPAKNEK